MKGKKRISLLAVLVCVFALVFSLGLMSACGTDESAGITTETADGATWYYGASAPAATLGKEGDYYLDTETLASYVKTNAEWRSAEANEVGAWFYGENDPMDTVGAEGDFYLNLKTGALYHKSSQGWGTSVLTLKGEQGKPGRDGVLWFSGAKDPEGTDLLLKDAIAGDFYLNTTDFTVWQLTAKGETTEWVKLGSIKPEDGATGQTGPEGPRGPQGDQGPIGPDGKSAYELYVEQYKATHDDENYMDQDTWLASLKGEKGEQGVQGEQGKQGDQGIQGPTGAQGVQGDPGENGKSAYELYVEQYKKDNPDAQSGWMTEEDWLASLKGDPGKDSVHFYNGDGEPVEGNPAIPEEPVEGDLYVGQFDGTDGKGSGSILYRYIKGEWVPILTSMSQPGTISIVSLDKFVEFSQLVAEGKIAEGSEVHLKTNIDFTKAAALSVKARAAMAIAAEAWTPIGTAAHPFIGTFDGEGHTITGLTISGENAGLFATTKNATIKNLTIINANVEATENGKAGILVADAKGTLEVKNVVVENGTVKAAEGVDATVGALVGSAEEQVTAGGVTVELTEESDPDLAQNNTIVGEGDITYSKEDGASGFKTEVEEGFDKLVDLANDNKETFEISNLNGFKKFRDSVNTAHETYSGKVVTLAAEIVLDEENYTMIGQGDFIFAGTFDGKGHTISDLTLTAETENAGLFSKLAGTAAIQNLTLDTVTITGTTKIGAFAGSSDGACTFTNCTVRNATLSGQNEIGSFIGSSVNGAVNTSALEKVTIVVDWSAVEEIQPEATVDAGAYIGKDTNPTVDKSSQGYESEVTFEYKGIMAKVGSKPYATVQDAFYAVYDMGADADDRGDIVIELLQDVTVDKAMIKANAFKSGSSTYYAWIDAFGRSDGYGANGNHTGSNGKEINDSWPSYTFNGNNHTITIANGAFSSAVQDFLIYTGGNSDWTITFENLNITGNAASYTAFEIIMPDIKDNFMPEIVFKNVNVTGEWNTILHMNAKAIVTLDGCNFTDTLNEKPYSNSGSKNTAFAVLMSYSGNGSSIYLKNGSYISSICNGYYSSYDGYSRVYVDATSSMNYNWLLATFAANKYTVQGAFIFDGAVPEQLQLNDANKLEFTYEQQNQSDKLFSTRIQDGGKETQWFLDTEVVTELKTHLA